MDNNQAAVNPTALNQVPVAQPVANPVQAPPPSGGNKKIWFIIITVALILIAAGGVYRYINQQNKLRIQETTLSKPTPPAETLDTLENELNAASLADLDQEFSSVNPDIQGL